MTTSSTGLTPQDQPRTTTAPTTASAGVTGGAPATGKPDSPDSRSTGSKTTVSTTQSRPAGASPANISSERLDKSIIRRGLATETEIMQSKLQFIEKMKREKTKPELKTYLDHLVASGVLTRRQADRVIQDIVDRTPLTIPGYELKEELGKGSMGMVYKARQTSVDRIVAVKVLLEKLAGNKEFTDRFEREAKIAAKLSHSNIVGVIDAGVAAQRHYFVMEYVEGRTVKDEQDQGKIFDEADALPIIRDVARALQHAHQKGMIHRDVKPENIILTADGQVKLADLGLARPTDDHQWANSEAGMAIGTPYYISPEQVRGQTDIDARADLYSLGATLYHMVTGRVPYSGTTPTEVMKKHVNPNIELVPPDHINDQISSGLGVVVETLMERDRIKRYQNADDLLIDLDHLLQGKSPIIAARDTHSLASLAEGETSEDHTAPRSPEYYEQQISKLTAQTEGRQNTLVILAVLLGISVVANLLLLLIS